MVLSIAMHVATPSAPERQLWLPVILAMALGAAATPAEPVTVRTGNATTVGMLLPVPTG